jgi:hypothetical protein
VGNVVGRSPDSQGARDKTRFTQFTRSIIKVVAVIFGLLVGYLQIRDIRPDAILTPSTADIVWRIALVAYYWSWVSGVNFDINLLEAAYVAFPNQRRWPAQLYVTLSVFVLMAAILLISFGHIAAFSTALTGFLIVDYASWLHIRKFVRSSVEASRLYYSNEKKFYQLSILNMVERNVFGWWKLRRLMVGAAILIVTDVFAFNSAFREATASVVLMLCPWLSSSDAIPLFYSMLFFLYVLVMELWVWMHRVHIYVRLETLDYLNALYHLTPR